jgi:hypothetical protein
VWGVIDVRVSFLNKYSNRLRLGLQGIYILRIVKGINIDGIFSIQAMSVRTDKF